MKPSSRVLGYFRRERVRLWLLPIGAVAIAMAVIIAHAQLPVVDLVADAPGVGTLDQRYMIALPIGNEGTGTASNVQVTGASFGGAPRLSPAAFPMPLGTIAPGGNAVFQADFDVTGLSQDGQYPLTVTGTFQINETTFGFTVTRSLGFPPASTGTGATQTTMIPAEDSSNGVSAGNITEVDEPDDDNETAPVPVAPFFVGSQTPIITALQPTPFSGGDSNVSAVAFDTKESLNLTGQTDPAEPSVASGGGLVFLTFNWGAAYREDGDTTFTILNPKAMFPPHPYGVCCDQHVQYLPAPIDRFVWIQQLNSSDKSLGGAYRLAVASPSDIKKFKGQKAAWNAWVLKPDRFTQLNAKNQIVPMPQSNGFDFPTLAVGNKFLHISWDVNQTVGFEVLRIALSDLQAAPHNLPIRFVTNPAQSGGCTSNNSASCLAFSTVLTQDTGDEVFWAGHNGNSKLRVFNWAEDSNAYHWREVGIDSFTPAHSRGSSAHTPSNAPSPILQYTGPKALPSSNDWLYRGGGAGAIRGATRSGSKIYFAWNADPGGTIPKSHVEVAEIDISTYTKSNQGQIWNDKFAFAFPSLSTNACTGEIGVSLAYGGGAKYPNHAVGFWGDSTFYPTTDGSVTGSSYGDYVTIRQNHTSGLHGAYFDAVGYAIQKLSSAGSGSPLTKSEVSIDIRHVVFGRSGACAGGS